MTHIDIKTKIPHPESQNIIDAIAGFEAKSMQGQMPIVWDRAENFNVWDCWGNKFLDFTSSIFVANCGHSTINEKLKEQLDKGLIHSYNYPTVEKMNLLSDIYALAQKEGHRFYQKTFLASSGAEANESAIKIMRIAGTKKNKFKKIIISYEGSMHGKTALTENLSHNSPHLSSDPLIIRLSYPTNYTAYREHIKILETRKQQICGIIFETYQGWSARFMPARYVKEMVDYCILQNIIVCFDEIQSGFYRTGPLFGFQHYKVEPDLVTFGKGFGGGIPISGVGGRNYLLDLPEQGQLSSTHSGNPLGCVGASASLEALDNIDKLEFQSLIHGFNKYIDLIFNAHTGLLTSVNQSGLLAGLVFKSKEVADKVATECMKKGLLVVNTGRESIKLAPPLTITRDALIEGMEVLHKAILHVKK